MILAQDRREPVTMKLELEARLNDRLIAYAEELASDPDYIAKEILRDHLAGKGAKRNGKEKKGKKA